MKKQLLLCALLLQAICMHAQEQFGKGTKTIDVNLGLGSPYWGAGYKHAFPFNPRIGMEYGITDEISLGGSIAYSGAKYDWGNIYGSHYTLKYNAYFISARGAYHFKLDNEKLDPYLGASIGYVVVSVKDDSPYGSSVSSVGSGVGYGGFGGIRYYIKPKLGLNAELGYSSFSFLNLGVSFKL